MKLSREIKPLPVGSEACRGQAEPVLLPQRLLAGVGIRKQRACGYTFLP
jgi:hypothetical protein